jgi:hypothetical protein
MSKWCAMSVQAMCLQRLGHTLAIEHAADAIDAKAPERTFAVLAHEVVKSTQLLRASWMELELTAFPARPGVGSHPEELRRLSLGQCTECAPEVDQVQRLGAGRDRAIRHV